MSIAAAAARIDEIQQTFWPTTAPDTKTNAANATTFAAAIAGIQETETEPGPYLTTEVVGQDIVDLADKYVGVRKVDGGDSYQGVDDSGLVHRVLADLGVKVPRSGKEQAGIGFEVGSLADAKPGDLLVGNDGHIAIYAGDGKVIHAPEDGRKVVKTDNPFTDQTLATIRRIVPDHYTFGGTVNQAAAPGADQGTFGQKKPAATTASPASTAQPTASVQASPPVQQSQALAAQLLITTQSATAVQAAAGIGAETGTVAGFAGSAAQAVASALGDQGTSALAAAAAAAAASSSTVDAAAPAATTTLSPAVKAEFTQQVSAPVVNLAQNAKGDQTLTLRVSPENLGPITLKAQIINGTVHIELASATDAGRDALRQVLTDLRRDLAGISSQSTLTVATGDTATGGQSSQGQQSALLNANSNGSGARDQHQQQGLPGQPAGKPAVTVPTPTPPIAPTVPGARIDLYA